MKYRSGDMITFMLTSFLQKESIGLSVVFAVGCVIVTFFPSQGIESGGTQLASKATTGPNRNSFVWNFPIEVWLILLLYIINN